MSIPTIPLVGALLAGLWAALLALAEGALAADPRLAATALPRLYMEKPERLRRALAIGRIVLLALAAIAFSGAMRWWERGILAGTAWFLVLVVGLGLGTDLLPRLVGLWRSALVGPWAVRITAATLAMPAPIFVAVGIIDRAFARLFGAAEPGTPTRDVAQREMMLGVFALADTMVAEVMTPRVDIVALDTRLAFDAVVAQVASAEFARLPVYDGDMDHIVGILYAKDLLPARFGLEPAGDWHRLVRTLDVVPEVKTLDRQLRDFQRGPSHMALVVDEFGGTAGLVTLEDVLEEIVGEIADEYDLPPASPVVEEGAGVLVADGRAALEDLSAAMGQEIEHEEVTTAGGWVYSLFGRVPHNGESVTIPSWTITVVRVEKKRITRLKLERSGEPVDGQRASRPDGQARSAGA